MDEITFINKLIYLFQNYYDLKYSDTEKLYNNATNNIQEDCVHCDNNLKGETMPTYKQFIDLEELQNFILKYMQSDDLEDIFTSTCFYTESNSSRLFDAMQYGVLLIGLVIGTSKVPKYAFIKDQRDR